MITSTVKQRHLKNSTPDRASSWIWPQHQRFIWIFCLEWKAAGNSVIAPFPEIFGPHIHVRTRQFTTSKRHLNFCNAGASFPTSLSAVIRRCKNVITIINLASEKVSAQLAPAVSLTSTARLPLVLLFPPLLRGDASSLNHQASLSCSRDSWGSYTGFSIQRKNPNLISYLLLGLHVSRCAHW